MARRTVKLSQDFQRVRDLPRRKISNINAGALAREMERMLLRPGKRGHVRDRQAVATYEALQCGGAFIVLPVGDGKTLTAQAIAKLSGAERVLVIAPASLCDKTEHDYAELAKTWKTVPVLVLSSRSLAVDSGEKLIEEYDPDLIILEESDDLANRHSAAARRVDRFVLSKPDVMVVALTATPSRNSIMAYWHILAWCLRDNAPIPMREGEALSWASAIDQSVRDESQRTRPGPLGATIAQARAWFRSRLEETSGVVIFDGDSCDQPLHLGMWIAREDARLNDAYEHFRKTETTPSGEDVSDPLSAWNLDNRMGCGLYLVMNPPPPTDWFLARRMFARFVRQTIRYPTGPTCDTEDQVRRRYPESETVKAWVKIKPTFKPNTEPRWISDSAVHSVKDWTKSHGEPAIIWSGSPDFSEALARVTGWRNFGSKGRDDVGTTLFNPPVGETIICSWHANMRGFNLQAWNRALIVFPPQSAKFLEQIIGRIHRSGQTRPCYFDFLITSAATLDGIIAAKNEANFVFDTLRSTFKIANAQMHVTLPRPSGAGEYRWGKAGAFNETMFTGT